MMKKGSVPLFRIRKGEIPSAHDILQAYPDEFSALLEDPTYSGRQILVSRAGKSRALFDMNDGQEFFETWKDDLFSSDIYSPGIRCLVYAAYEAGGLIEALPKPKTSISAPLLWLHYPAWSLVFDQQDQCCHLCALKESDLDYLESLLDCALYVESHHSITVSKAQDSDPERYEQAVEKVREYIRAGDVFQANIARFWQTPLVKEKVYELYACLREVNAAPFSCFVRVETCEDDSMYIISSSPERLFQLHADGTLETRPIAGTRKRGEDLHDDALREELLLSEKERAEHIMLVDLERNDLGRVCEPGSVEVNEHMTIERYPTVQHIVSNVRGKLSAEKDIVDIFKAMFPGGTITGCPKVRCMEIIHELEQQARGPYTGGVGYIAWDGSADMNILIRTFWQHQGKLNWAAGAGIVADSDPNAELEEVGFKAAGLLRALRTIKI